MKLKLKGRHAMVVLVHLTETGRQNRHGRRWIAPKRTHAVSTGSSSSYRRRNTHNGAELLKSTQNRRAKTTFSRVSAMPSPPRRSAAVAAASVFQTTPPKHLSTPSKTHTRTHRSAVFGATSEHGRDGRYAWRVRGACGVARRRFLRERSA